MGFRKDAYATIWDIETITDTLTKARISISRRDKQTGEFEPDFSGFVGFMGTAAAKKAACLKEKDRIKLGDVDVSNRYDKEKKTKYTNYKVFSFETQEELTGNNVQSETPAPKTPVDEGEIDDSRLPF